MKHDYRIEGHVNGRHVLGRGSGQIDPSTGVSEMDVRFERMAEGWDPRTIVLMCCDRALIMAAQETTDYPHYLPEQAVEIPYYQLLRVEAVEQELDGNHLYSKVTTRVLPLTPPGDDTVSATVERMATLA
ncbi:MAG: hypothetical protein ACRDSL_25895 [Pseudonocardiaceae bacterium]